MEINVLIEEGIETEAGLDAGWMQSVIETVLSSENTPPNAEISLVITGQSRIQELNRDYRGKDQPTDVLSFAMSEQQEGDDPVAFINPPYGLIPHG